MSRALIVGAGLAGLSAAVRLRLAGWEIAVWESARQAGGRARSYHDEQLGCRIDNGNHLLLSGNRSAIAYLETIGATDELTVVRPARVPFVDLEDGTRWAIRPNAGPLAWWPLAPGRRAPGSRARDYLAALRLAWAGDRTVAQVFGAGRAFRRFWEPLAVAVLNTEAREAAARLLWPVMTEIAVRGEAAFRPCIARRGLSEAFVDPAIAWLRARGGELHLGARCRGLEIADGRVAGINLGGAVVAPGPRDAVILAVPPAAVAGLVEGALPDLRLPDGFSPIVNLHFRCDRPLPMPDGAPLLGLVGGTAQWLFQRGSIASVTISAAGALTELPPAVLIERAWGDIRRALDLDDVPAPPARVLTEKRATIAQTPAQISRRPPAHTAVANLLLAGDWTDTGLPATIEGAIRSGEIAAEAAGPPIG